MLTPGDGIAVASICSVIAITIVAWSFRNIKIKTNETGCSLIQLKECSEWQKEITNTITELKLETANSINELKLDINTINGHLDKLVELFETK